MVKSILTKYVTTIYSFYTPFMEDNHVDKLGIWCCYRSTILNTRSILSYHDLIPINPGNLADRSFIKW